MMRLIYTFFISCILYAGDNQIFDIQKINDVKTKKYLLELEKSNPLQASILKDYYEALTCKKDFYNLIGVDELRNFSLTEDYENLFKASTKDGEYEELIDQISFFNCNEKN